MRTVGLLCAAALQQDNAAGPLERRAEPVTAQNPVPRLTRTVMPQNLAIRAPTIVALRVTLDEQGRVGEIRPLGAGARYSFYVSRPLGGEVLAFMPITDQMPPRPEVYEASLNAAMNAVRQWEYEPPRNGPIVFNVLLGFDSPEAHLLSNGVTADPTPGIAPASAAPTTDLRADWAQSAVRVSGNNAPSKVKDVAIDYPPIAQSARVQGVVTIDARVEPDGRVSNAQVVGGPPLLRQVSLDSVRQWEFTPTVLNGKAVPVIVTTTIEFRFIGFN